MPIRVHTTLNEASDRCGWPNRHLVAIAIRYYVGSGDGDISWITEFTPFILQYGVDGYLDKAMWEAEIPKPRLWVRSGCICMGMSMRMP